MKRKSTGGVGARYPGLGPVWASVSPRAPLMPKVGGDDGKAVLFCQVILIFPYPTVPK